jgi:hypothetical protein
MNQHTDLQIALTYVPNKTAHTYVHTHNICMQTHMHMGTHAHSHIPSAPQDPRSDMDITPASMNLLDGLQRAPAVVTLLSVYLPHL